ncbi:hemoglobin type 1 [Biomphalaria glabrata]|nr:uncharacterized protein LOC106073907 isoform X2 [Biomphalaria glabrata]XP_055884113.1 uncharacterized protein LOC106073907 isoform X2 [Biomphalaria glabrata]KAI8732978.1 hemoglobin type 2; partial [Biomphalaria glabrata]KAI8781545.1 hemoglobin type 2 [Biomphalaria glabrata]KAK0062359.1 hemoglobin type 2 [Biomphalaria pfeifferi]
MPSPSSSKRGSSLLVPQDNKIARLRRSISGMMDRGSTEEEARCLITEMTIKEKEMLHASWTRVYGLTDAQRKASGIKLLSWLLDHVPNMRSRIVLKQPPDQNEDPPVMCRWFIHLSVAVPNTIDDMVRHLKDPIEFNNYLGNIARYHIDQEPPVTVQYFKDFETMFPLYVQALLELPSNSDEIILWKKLFGLLTRRVQQESIAAGLDENPKKRCCVIL